VYFFINITEKISLTAYKFMYVKHFDLLNLRNDK
jgi:hypothetical protein